MSASGTDRDRRRQDSGPNPRGGSVGKQARDPAQDRELDLELEQSFPASDPPSITQPAPARERAPKQARERAKKSGA